MASNFLDYFSSLEDPRQHWKVIYPLHRAIALDLSCAQSRVAYGRGHAIATVESLNLSLPSPKDLETVRLRQKYRMAPGHSCDARRADALDSALASAQFEE